MSEKQTKKFVKFWNIANDMPVTEDTPAGNMRYVSPGIVTWNECDAPEIDLIQIKDLLEKL
jgi:hypothetical protein